MTFFERCYREAQETGDYKNALLVGQNLFHKNPSDADFFDAYFNMMLDCCKSNGLSDFMLDQMAKELSVFSDSVEMNVATLNSIRKYEDILNNLIDTNNRSKENAKREGLKKIIVKNDEYLAMIQSLLSKVQSTTSENEFNALLSDMTKLDESLSSSNFVKRQQEQYTSLTKQFSEAVDAKMKRFEHQKNVEYNAKALECYEKVYKAFKAEKGVSYSQNDLKEFFEYDSSRLFNETIVYYNQVYNYILSKLTDEEKIALTKLAIASEKKR